MKILIITNALYPRTNANSAIAYRIADQLRLRFGVEIAFLGEQTGEAAPINHEYRTWYLTKTYHYTQLVPEGLPKWKKLLRYALHPWTFFYRRRLKTERYPLQSEYEQLLRQVLAKESFDAILCFTCPYDTVMAAADAAGETPIISYMLDPWGTHYLHEGKPQYAEDEQRVAQRCAAKLITKELYRDYEAGTYQPGTDKVIPLEFPNLVPPVVPQGFSAGFEHGKIHCAYVGQLYEESLRGPAAMFSLFEKLEAENIILHVIGNSDSQARAYRDRLPSNVILHGRVSPQEAKGYMMAADILINMGKTIPNQLPSKTIDYISCGKPILNLCKIPDCPTIPYMETYPLSLCVQESEEWEPQTIQKVAAFCKSNTGKELPFTDITAIFPECTPEYVAEQVYQVLCEVVNSSGNPGK